MAIWADVEKVLVDDGWSRQICVDGSTDFKKTIKGFAEAGTVSDGTRVVTINLCPRGRYLGLVDGWGNCWKDVDLRETESAKVAIETLIGETKCE